MIPRVYLNKKNPDWYPLYWRNDCWLTYQSGLSLEQILDSHWEGFEGVSQEEFDKWYDEYIKDYWNSRKGID